jgi:ActR/RegA family two-component response regulator
MGDENAGPLTGQHLLIVEDEYIIASDLARSLEERGAEVVGLAGSVEDALELVAANGARIDCAVLDVNLRDERVYPVADALIALGLPFIFTTGYDTVAIPDAYSCAPRCEKPVDIMLLVRQLAKLIQST